MREIPVHGLPAIFGVALALGVALAGAGCDAGSPAAPPGGESPTSGSEAVPLTDLAAGTYLGFQGGLYPGGEAAPPADHLAAGLEHAARIRPLDREGRPDSGGKYVLVSIGMSNTAQEFCGPLGSDCGAGTFVAQALIDPAVEQSGLAIVNGAQGGQDASDWDAPGERTYDRVRDEALAPWGVSELQVQIAWIKQAHARPSVSLPSPAADAYALERDLGEIVRSLAVRYPNLALVFVSSRTYAGYATTTLNPEPYAYESGFAVKWLIEAQIHQARTGEVDPVAGDLDPERFPWIGWGPYLWTVGMEGRSDGLTWEPGDVQADGTHPSSSGERKVGELLLEFFAGSPVAGCWFLAGLSCG
jgi:hypothetical protein